ncbi:ornithine carbamoyltransferase [Candidatus Bathyarchaeota archaeon]|nr:ornithine carbamoyltransferase [Candidatus Bathyarchaeota archaeon]
MSALKDRDFLKVADLTKDELMDILDLALKVKKVKWSKELEGRTLGMLFAKTSTRTRVSFEVAMTQLGGHAINMNWSETNFDKGDVKDESKVLGLYCDAVMTRVFTHQQNIELAKGCEKPLINGMDNLHHPCQALADLLTIMEEKGKLEGLKIAWVGDGTNVCNSLIQASDLLDIKMAVACPGGYEPKIKGKAVILRDPREAARNADVLVTDTWISLGLEKEKETRLNVFTAYQLNSNLLRYAKEDSIVLHCLPATRGYEITSDVMDSPQSRIFPEAENRLHTEKALLLKLIG